MLTSCKISQCLQPYILFDAENKSSPLWTETQSTVWNVWMCKLLRGCVSAWQWRCKRTCKIKKPRSTLWAEISWERPNRPIILMKVRNKTVKTPLGYLSAQIMNSFWWIRPGAAEQMWIWALSCQKVIIQPVQTLLQSHAGAFSIHRFSAQ